MFNVQPFNHIYKEYIPTVDYENDLDLLYLSIVSQAGDDVESVVHFYDNQTGALFYDHVISLDLDVLIHIVKSPMRKFSCYVYKMSRLPHDKLQSAKPKPTTSYPSRRGATPRTQAEQAPRKNGSRSNSYRRRKRKAGLPKQGND
ncbi:hypothetical protein LSH36_185g05049 [Paralvinella palmiformis]|uniref:Uncharacterized protein n=1 Tax=Paralvinella palmiformis TaxID=53620 RepID=A0AAD9N7E0_9ANNE|nr:hypothetical protein LSH36_185g05049 [Paralvinella palmiformis]